MPIIETPSTPPEREPTTQELMAEIQVLKAMVAHLTSLVEGRFPGTETSHQVAQILEGPPERVLKNLERPNITTPAVFTPTDNSFEIEIANPNDVPVQAAIAVKLKRADGNEGACEAHAEKGRTRVLNYLGKEKIRVRVLIPPEVQLDPAEASFDEVEVVTTLIPVSAQSGFGRREDSQINPIRFEPEIIQTQKVEAINHGDEYSLHIPLEGQHLHFPSEKNPNVKRIGGNDVLDARIKISDRDKEQLRKSGVLRKILTLIGYTSNNLPVKVNLRLEIKLIVNREEFVRELRGALRVLEIGGPETFPKIVEEFYRGTDTLLAEEKEREGSAQWFAERLMGLITTKLLAPINHELYDYYATHQVRLLSGEEPWLLGYEKIYECLQNIVEKINFICALEEPYFLPDLFSRFSSELHNLRHGDADQIRFRNEDSSNDKRVLFAGRPARLNKDGTIKEKADVLWFNKPNF